MKSTNPPFWDLILRRPAASRVAGGIAAAGFAAALLTSSPAGAQDGPQVIAEAGAFIGYTFGIGGGFTWGIEARGGAEFREEFQCDADPSGAALVTARLSMIDLRPQLHFGAQVGVTYGPASVMADYSLGHSFGENGGFSMPLGLELQVSAAEAFFRYDMMLDRPALGLGFLLPPPDRDFGCAVVGRPLNNDEGREPLPAMTALGELAFPTDVHNESAAALSGEWGQRAKGEWASVPAFIDLAEQLRLAGAPRALVQRALTAAEEELHHAIATAQVASCYSGAPLLLGACRPQPRMPAEGASGLRRLAVESYVDGCLGEGAAAAFAYAERGRTVDPTLRSVHEMVAVDEAAHAELAWDVLAWSVAKGGDDVRHAVLASKDASPHELGTTDSSEASSLADFGLLTNPERSSIENRVRDACENRLEPLLA